MTSQPSHMWNFVDTTRISTHTHTHLVALSVQLNRNLCENTHTHTHRLTIACSQDDLRCDVLRCTKHLLVPELFAVLVQCIFIQVGGHWKNTRAFWSASQDWEKLRNYNTACTIWRMWVKVKTQQTGTAFFHRPHDANHQRYKLVNLYQWNVFPPFPLRVKFVFEYFLFLLYSSPNKPNSMLLTN